MTIDIPTRLQGWCSAPHISARSVLVTILGDALLPVSNSVWLAQLFKLAEPCNFSARLVRTSLFRLADEGWVTSERHGRQSKYTLTPFAEREFADAAVRIYSNDQPALEGQWTLVLFDGTRISLRERERLARHLGRHGFVALDRGVLASPICGVDTVRQILAEAFPQVLSAVAAAEFTDIGVLLQEGFFASAFAFGDIEKAYRSFVDTYAEFDGELSRLSPMDAYCTRTMLIHDLRRITLRMPSLPRELLPTPWSGDEAYTLAARLYPQLCARSAALLGEVLELGYPALIRSRFSDRTPHRSAETDSS